MIKNYVKKKQWNNEKMMKHYVQNNENNETKMKNYEQKQWKQWENQEKLKKMEKTDWKKSVKLRKKSVQIGNYRSNPIA